MTVTRCEHILAGRTSDIEPADFVLACAARTLRRDDRLHGHGICRERLDTYQPIRTHIFNSVNVGCSERPWLGPGQASILGQMEHVIRRCSRIPEVRHSIGRALDLRMALLISANLLNRQPSFLQYFLEFLLSPAFGLREN